MEAPRAENYNFIIPLLRYLCYNNFKLTILRPQGGRTEGMIHYETCQCRNT